MSQAQFDTILKACQPVPLIAIQCGIPKSPQERANNAWAALGAVMGFDYMTVRPIGRGGDRFFTADPKAATDVG